MTYKMPSPRVSAGKWMHFLFPNAQVTMCYQYIVAVSMDNKLSYFAGMFIHTVAAIVVINVE